MAQGGGLQVRRRRRLRRRIHASGLPRALRSGRHVFRNPDGADAIVRGCREGRGAPWLAGGDPRGGRRGDRPGARRLRAGARRSAVCQGAMGDRARLRRQARPLPADPRPRPRALGAEPPLRRRPVAAQDVGRRARRGRHAGEDVSRPGVPARGRHRRAGDSHQYLVGDLSLHYPRQHHRRRVRAAGAGAEPGGRAAPFHPQLRKADPRGSRQGLHLGRQARRFRRGVGGLPLRSHGGDRESHRPRHLCRRQSGVSAFGHAAGRLLTPMSVRAARLAGCLAALIATAAPAEVKIAFVGALSGPQAWAGRDQRDGFTLALHERMGRLGGVEVRFSQFDERDRLAPEGVHVVTGLTTGESALALHERLRSQPVLIVSSGAGPLELAGERCSERFFSAAPPQDAVHENAGAIAHARRYRRVQLFAAPARRPEVEAAFRRAYQGDVVWGSELREVREARPHAVYLALPPQELVSFLKGYEGMGLFRRIPVIAAGVEPRELEALGPAFSGLTVSARWAIGMEREASMRFVEAFRTKFGRTPSTYAMQGYEAALLLDAALRLSPRDPARALSAARVEGVAGPIRLAANGFVATDWHAWEVFNESSGAPYLAARLQTLRSYVGPHAGRCKAR